MYQKKDGVKKDKQQEGNKKKQQKGLVVIIHVASNQRSFWFQQISLTLIKEAMALFIQ